MMTPSDSQISQSMLEEYRALRAEIQQSIRLQHTTFGVGISLVSIGLGLSQGTSGTTVIQLVLLAIPPLAYLTIALWLIEMARMMRAGNYLRLLENRFNEELKGVGLLWENWLRSQLCSPFDAHAVHRWAQSILVLLLLCMASAAIWGIYKTTEVFLLDKLVFVWVYGFFGVVLAVFSLPIVFHSRRGPTEYVSSTKSEFTQKFEEWLKRYRSELGPKP